MRDMALVTVKKILRPYLSPWISKLPFSIKKHIRRPGNIEVTEKRLADISSFDSTKGLMEVSLVVKKLKAAFLDISSLSSDFIYSLFLVLSEDSLSSIEEVNKLTEEASLIDSKLLDVPNWLGLYQLCCMRGLYHLGFEFREKAVEISLADEKNSIRYLAASLEKKNVLHKGLVEKVNDSDVDEKSRDKLLALSFLLGGKSEGLCDVSGLVDKNFKNYLRGKRVALVGPSESQMPDGEEIDDFDEVVRLNFSYPEKGCDENINGTKTTVTYFNLEQVRVFHDENVGVLPDGIKYACLKSHVFHDEIACKNTEVSVRRLVSFDGLFFNGSLNMGPIAALDIALHSSFPLKIYHMDLMLTVRRFQGYYPGSFKRNNDGSLVEVFKRSTINHDPVTQYRTFESMWRAGIIIGDKRFDEIMSLGCKEYMNQLQASYACLA